MAQPPLQLVIGNYNTSSWSLRAWLVMRLARLAFIEIRVPLRRADTPAAILRYSPSGKLPVLLVDGVPVWDSLGIGELVAEFEPGVWPVEAARRAEARSISAEMHSGFADLRRLMPMDMVSRFAPPGRLPHGLTTDISRVSAIWRSCRDRYAADGPFLFGAFTIADAMMAPVASRLVTHAVPLDPVLDDYVDSVMSWPDMVTWRDAAAVEVDELQDRGELEAHSVTRGGRDVSGEPVDRARPTAVAVADPSPARPSVPPPVVTFDDVPANLPDAAPDATAELPAMPEDEPAPDEQASPHHLDESEQVAASAIVASPPPPEQTPLPPDEPPPPAAPLQTDPAPAATSMAGPSVIDRPIGPQPNVTPAAGGQVAGGQVEGQRRPSGTTIKPIGSGILRRR